MPSLREILNDPNYTNANQATKEAIFNKYAPQDQDYTGANEATQQAIKERFGLAVAAPKAEEEPEEFVGAGAQFTGSSWLAQRIRRGSKSPELPP